MSIFYSEKYGKLQHLVKWKITSLQTFCKYMYLKKGLKDMHVNRIQKKASCKTGYVPVMLKKKCKSVNVLILPSMCFAYLAKWTKYVCFALLQGEQNECAIFQSGRSACACLSRWSKCVCLFCKVD
jgi:hypothetical protein